MDKTDTLLNEIIAHLEVGGIVPYLGPGVLDLVPGGDLRAVRPREPVRRAGGPVRLP